MSVKKLPKLPSDDLFELLRERGCISHCQIYKHLGSDSSWDGISSRFDDCYLVWDCENPPDFVRGLPVVVARIRRIGDENYTTVQPVVRPPADRTSHYMFGGCYVVCADGLYPGGRRPISLHDRAETREFFNSCD